LSSSGHGHRNIELLITASIPSRWTTSIDLADVENGVPGTAQECGTKHKPCKMEETIKSYVIRWVTYKYKINMNF